MSLHAKRNNIVLIIIVCLMSVYVWLISATGKYYQTFSPDRQYSVFAKKYNWASLIPMMPGSGSDAPGKIFLYDEIEKEVIGEIDARAIGHASDIEWDTNKAYFVGDDFPNIIDAWKLPRPLKYSSVE